MGFNHFLNFTHYLKPMIFIYRNSFGKISKVDSIFGEAEEIFLELL